MCSSDLCLFCIYLYTLVQFTGAEFEAGLLLFIFEAGLLLFCPKIIHNGITTVVGVFVAVWGVD